MRRLAVGLGMPSLRATSGTAQNDTIRSHLIRYRTDETEEKDTIPFDTIAVRLGNSNSNSNANVAVQNRGGTLQFSNAQNASISGATSVNFLNFEFLKQRPGW
jgi:hypothetical protein